jgi:hypothetical protein
LFFFLFYFIYLFIFISSHGCLPPMSLWNRYSFSACSWEFASLHCFNKCVVCDFFLIFFGFVMYGCSSLCYVLMVYVLVHVVLHTPFLVYLYPRQKSACLENVGAFWLLFLAFPLPLVMISAQLSSDLQCSSVMSFSYTNCLKK